MSIAHLTDNDPVGWHLKVNDLLSYWEGPGAAPTSFGFARSRLNAMAATLGLPTIAEADAGSVRRAKVNALIDGSGLPAGLDLYADFTTGRYWDNGGQSMAAKVVDTWSGGLLPNAGGGYDSFGPNVLARNSLGLWTQPTRTNKCSNRNANPVDTSGMTRSGDASSTLTVVDDAAALAAAGLSGVCTSGMVYKLDNSAGTVAAFVDWTAQAGSTNPHVCSVFWRGTGNATIRLTTVDISGGGTVPVPAGYQRRASTITPPTAAERLRIRAEAGAVVYFILNQLEEGTYATHPIVTNGSTATRTSNRQNIALGSRASIGVAGFIKLDLKAALLDNQYALLFGNGAGAAERVGLVGIGGNVCLTVGTSNLSSALINPGAIPLGLVTFVFAATENFAKLHIVGGANPAVDTSVIYPSSVSQLSIGGMGTVGQSFQATKKVGAVFATPSKPINQALFDQIYAMAVAA